MCAQTTGAGRSPARFAESGYCRQIMGRSGRAAPGRAQPHVLCAALMRTLLRSRSYVQSLRTWCCPKHFALRAQHAPVHSPRTGRTIGCRRLRGGRRVRPAPLERPWSTRTATPPEHSAALPPRPAARPARPLQTCAVPRLVHTRGPRPGGCTVVAKFNTRPSESPSATAELQPRIHLKICIAIMAMIPKFCRAVRTFFVRPLSN